MVTILTGDSDNLIRPSNSRVLKQHMPEAELRVWEDTGHAMHIQWPKRYCNLLKETFEEGKRRHNKTSTL
jgi:pimeloyl-ACP methyl ester carboxylesterase